MLLDIKLVRQHGNDCLEDLYATVTAFWGIEYEMAFIEAWRFSFKPGPINSFKTIGDKLHTSKGNINRLLKQYHGVSASPRRKNSFQLLKLIQEQLGENHPVIINLPIYWMPWSSEYKKEGALRGHLSLVIGMDDSDNLYCVDTLSPGEYSLLPREDFYQGVKWACTISNQGKGRSQFNWRKAVERNVLNLYGKRNFRNTFDRIRFLADFIETRMNFSLEIKGTPNLWNAPILANLRRVGYGRIQFARALRYISRKFDAAELLPICNELEIAGSSWDAVRDILIKGQVASNLPVMQPRAAFKLRKIADLEEKIAESLLKITGEKQLMHCHDNVCPENDSHSSVCQDDVYRITGTLPATLLNRDSPGITHVNLAPFLNNNGIGTFSDDCTASLTGYRQFLLKDDLPPERIWKIHRMSFIFPEFSDGSNDNVSCASQIIPVDEGSYSGLWLLGCAEWGSYSDVILMKYTNGEVEEINIQCTDFGKQSIFHEMVAWEGRGAEIREGKVRLIGNTCGKYRIYAQEYPLKLKSRILQSIILPECPNIHIFALSLRKSLGEAQPRPE